MDTLEVEDFDYGELKNDTAFIKKNETLSECIERIRQNLAVAREDYKNYESFSLEEKVKYDLHLSYSINSLYWMYYKIIGLDPNKVSFGRGGTYDLDDLPTLFFHCSTESKTN